MPSKNYKIGAIAAYNGSQDAIEELYIANETIANLEEQLQNAGNIEEVINGTVNSLSGIDDGSVIRAGLFDGCDNLVSYSNKSGYLSSIGENAFRNCTSLTTLPNFTRDIRLSVRCFQGCTSLNPGRYIRSFEDYSVPEHCFENTNFNGAVSFGDGCNYINAYSFRLTKVSTVNIRQAANPLNGNLWGTQINGYAFENCTQLTTINIYNEHSVEIMLYAFSGCTALSTINNSELITGINDRSFSGCTSLTSFHFGSDVTVNSNAFYGCSNLRNLSFDGTVSQARNKFRFLTGIPATTIQCSDGVYTIGS